MDGGALRSVTALPLVLAFVGLGSGDVAAQEETQDVRGTVVDAVTGDPIAGAFVQDLASGRGVFADEEGRFRLPDELDGREGVSARQVGYRDVRVDPEWIDPEVELTIQLDPDPVALEEITVLRDRFEDRRRRSPQSVRVYDQEDLAAHSGNALDFIVSRSHRVVRSCGADFFPAMVCVRDRRDRYPLQVTVDEFSRSWDAERLRTLPLSELYMVEIYGGGRQVRAYTRHWMDRLAQGGRGSGIQLMPVVQWGVLR